MVSILPLISSSPRLFSRVLGGSFQRHQLQFVLRSLSCSTHFSALWQDPSICLYFRFFFFDFCSMVCWNSKIQELTSSFILLINTISTLGLGGPFVFPILRELYDSFSGTDSGLCAYHRCGQFSVHWLSYPVMPIHRFFYFVLLLIEI